MNALALQVATESGGLVEQVARTFGVDWPHLLAQIVSFGIVCFVLYVFAYKPILRMLEARRQQIAGGLANAEKIREKLARIEVERQKVLSPGRRGRQAVDCGGARGGRPRRGRGDQEGDGGG